MVLSDLRFLYILDISPLSASLQTSSLIQLVAFLFCWWFTLLCKNFLVWCSPICLFLLLLTLPEDRHSKKLLLRLTSKSLLPVFSSRHFMVSRLTFKSLIHFEFIIVYSVRKWSSLILLHVAVQFSQHHLWKRLSLPHCIFLPPLL